MIQMPIMHATAWNWRGVAWDRGYTIVAHYRIQNHNDEPALSHIRQLNSIRKERWSPI